MAMTPPNLGGDWLGKYGKERTVSRAFLMGEGFTSADMDGRPIIGICNSWSELNNCNSRRTRDAI